MQAGIGEYCSFDRPRRSSKRAWAPSLLKPCVGYPYEPRHYPTDTQLLQVLTHPLSESTSSAG
ncbi:MAG TPA: hypothetical protein VFK10_20820 [Burkholderiaceae bacterium]|nr:hypothetical protein [Burkholderiaceae bacterium]